MKADLAAIRDVKTPTIVFIHGAFAFGWVLATILVLWVAWFRFRYYFPSVPRPDIWFGLVLPDTLIIISWIWDKRVNGRLHPVPGWVGVLIIIEQSCEILLYDSPAWRSFGKAIFEALP